MTRRNAVVKVQIARRDLGLDEDTYRAMLERLTGRTSSSACTDAQLGRVLDEMKAKGWKPKVVTGGRAARSASTRVAPASSPVAKKARALWISLHQLGVVRDPSEAALEAFGKRQLKVERLHWAKPYHADRLVEALKAMACRAGWDQDLTGFPPETDLIKVLKARLARAQAERLGQTPLADYYRLASAVLDALILLQAEAIHALLDRA